MRKSLFSIFAITIINLTGCAAHRKEIQLQPLQEKVTINPQKICEARLSLRANAKDEQLLSEAALSFELQNDQSKAELKIMNSLFMTVAKLNLSNREVHWVDQDGEKNIAEHPLFQRWFQAGWWQEFAFLFGIPLVETQASILQNERGQPVVMRINDRQLKCDYDETTHNVTLCTIEDPSFSAKLNFTSAECRSPI